MNDDQIAALSREYAEECAKGFAPADMPNCLKNEATGILVCNAEDVLKWLSHRFCLVEKSKVETLYNITWNEWNFTKDVGNRKQSKLILDTLESLFPEIAKEVEG